MSICKIEFTRRAAIQIRNLFAYIAQEDPKAALKMAGRIETRIQRLEESPELGAELPGEEYPFLAPGYRRLLVQPFIGYYRVMEDTVYIIHVVGEESPVIRVVTKRGDWTYHRVQNRS